MTSFRFIYSPECLGIMSRKRSSSGILFELEDSRDKENLAVSPGLTKSLSETEIEKQDFDGFSAGISTVS